MIQKHKKTAIAGVAVWLAMVVVFIGLAVLNQCLSEATAWLGGLSVLGFLFGICVQYVAFFWGGRHLAKGKGYSTGMLLFGLFWPAQGIILAVLLFGLTDRHADPVRHKERHNHESQIARVVRYRRNALVMNGLGVLGVLLALALFFLPLGLFASRSNAVATAILIFIPSYSAIIYGCWWWVRAKSWHEAVVFIGLMPLAVLFIPYVRLIYRVAPLMLPCTMVLMPILLIGVVAVLPDKSGMPTRRR